MIKLKNNKPKIKVIGNTKNDRVLVEIPEDFFIVISNYILLDNNNKLFSENKIGVCFIKNGI